MADFLLRGHPDAAFGAKTALFLGVREVAVTGWAVTLAYPYGSIADRALGHEGPPNRAACHLGNKIFYWGLFVPENLLNDAFLPA
jgi:hypothetical protein